MKYKIVIPARGGSKRFPGKNLAELNGKTLLHHTINYALQFFDKKDIWLNSDDEGILNEGNNHHIQLCKRPSEIAMDETPTSDVIKYQIDFFEKNNIDCDAIILLQVTNPIRPKTLLSDAVKVFETSKRNSLATFTPMNKKYGRIINGYFHPKNYQPGQRMQDIATDFYENGLLYITNIESARRGEIITTDVYPLVIDDIAASVDIDEPNDLIWAQYIINIYENK